MKILERFVHDLIKQVVSVDDSQICFIQGKGTTDAIFVVSQETHSTVNKWLNYNGLLGPGEGIGPCSLEDYLVSSGKAGC